MIKWFFLTLFLFAAINWFLVPQFPEVAKVVPHLSIWATAGLSAIVLVGMMLFGKGK